MAIPEYVAQLRAVVGHGLLVLPSVSILITDESGRLLLVRHTGHHDGWATIGGILEPEESPADTAVREAREELGVTVRLRQLLDVHGGPDFTVTYPNGDRVSYMTAVYQAEIVDGVPVADLDEISEVAWFTPEEVSGLPLSRSARAILKATGQICLEPNPPLGAGLPVS